MTQEYAELFSRQELSKLMMRMSAVCFCAGLAAAALMQNILMLRCFP
jgi:hypothetical protein